MPGAVTALDVARRADVSRSAVSRCFTAGASIAPDTRARILAAADALGYRPNALARSLITRRSGLIAVVLGQLDNPFYADLLARLAAALQTEGYRLLLFFASPQDAPDPLVGQILPYQVDGIVLAATSLTSGLADACAGAGIPVVLVNRTTDRPAVASVTSANREGGRLAARFLLAAGHRRMAYVAGAAGASTNRDRALGFTEVLQETGLGPPLQAEGHYSHAGAAAAARTLLASPEPPEAVFCANDHMAVAVLDTARREFGLRVPVDLSVVGFDDAPQARWGSYALTTVEQPVGSMVAAAVSLLVGQIRGQPVAMRHEAVAGALVVRDTARRPAAGIIHDGDREVWRPAP
ncbi:MAG: LacI family DNA-binding transcriptional regulator [Alsobacter sp.]